MHYDEFIFESYDFEPSTATASFRYSFDGDRKFVEQVVFQPGGDCNIDALDRSLFLAFILAGISYYKSFPTKRVRLRDGEFSLAQAVFFTQVYTNGLSQFIYENKLSPDNLAVFTGVGDQTPVEYAGNGSVVLQSGGKDSLLLVELLKKRNISFTPLHITPTSVYPMVLDELGAQPLRTIKRSIDIRGLTTAKEDGGYNGHVPVTYIVLAYALIDVILHNQHQVLAAIGREGEEPHEYIGDYPVTHQWSKTWHAEQLFADYVRVNVSESLKVGSPLRGYSELRIAELFARDAWPRYSGQFSSCNRVNYMQGADNRILSWCGECPKCANNFLLFAPFVAPDGLTNVFGSNLLQKDMLVETFKGLLGIDGVMKPFECVGEIDELRLAYHKALDAYPDAGYQLPFVVPESSFDYKSVGQSQAWAESMLQ